MFWVPQSGRMGMGISIFSYEGSVVVGFATDAGLVPDPEAIAQAFEDEFRSLQEWAGTRPASVRLLPAAPEETKAKKPRAPRKKAAWPPARPRNQAATARGEGWGCPTKRGKAVRMKPKT